MYNPGNPQSSHYHVDLDIHQLLKKSCFINQSQKKQRKSFLLSPIWEENSTCLEIMNLLIYFSILLRIISFYSMNFDCKLTPKIPEFNFLGLLNGSLILFVFHFSRQGHISQPRSGTHCVDQIGLKLQVILLPRPSKC